MSVSGTTVNPFARVLYFYYLYLRFKLVPGDVDKIAKKYGSKQDMLLTDLQQKYTFPIPQEVPLLQLSAICSRYAISGFYMQYMGVLEAYDPRSDVYSADFDPLHCLARNTISVSHLSAPTLDNTSKLLLLLPGNEQIKAPIVSAPRSASSSSLSAVDAGVPGAPKSKHLFEQIADAAVSSADGTGSAADEVASPLLLLRQCMVTHTRVRIITRRHNSVRGSMDAFILAFDRHFNMLLSDVDEEFITNQQRRRAVVQGRFRNQANVQHRHLPQALLRGDQVVMVFRKPP